MTNRNHLGALIDKDIAKVYYLWIVIGGKIDGNFVTPTIYETTTDDKKALEIFKYPVLSETNGQYH